MESKKTIVFGDIHGCSSALEQAILIAQTQKLRAIFLGDYIDRGPDSIKTLKLLISAKKNNPEWIFLRGNHDQMLLDLIIDNELRNKTRVLDSGNLMSYAETTKTLDEVKKENLDFRKKVLDFLNELEYYFENNHYIFLHSPLKEGNIPLLRKKVEDLIWNYRLDPIWTGKPFIHGHALVDKPLKTNNGLNINTGCGYGGFLTGFILDTSSETQLYVAISEDGSSITKTIFKSVLSKK